MAALDFIMMCALPVMVTVVLVCAVYLAGYAAGRAEEERRRRKGGAL